MNDDDLGAVLICAVRYCLGRRTYMPSLVVSWIIHNAHLSGKDMCIMLRDIDEQEKRFGLGDSCDVETWHRFRNWLEEGIRHHGTD